MKYVTNGSSSRPHRMLQACFGVRRLDAALINEESAVKPAHSKSVSHSTMLRDMPEFAPFVSSTIITIATLLLLPAICLAGMYIGLPPIRTVEETEEPIVKNGGFEEIDPEDKSKPRYWFKPDGLGVQWTREPGHGKVMRIDTSISEKDMVAKWKEVGINDFWDIPNAENNAIAATYGLSYYSDLFPVTNGQAYRVSFDFKTTASGGGAKLWVRGYGMIKGQYRRRYETVINCRDGGKEWKRLSQAFHPTRLRPKVKQMKVMLYAYWPPGVYWFDNVKIEPITDEEYDKSRQTP